MTGTESSLYVAIARSVGLRPPFLNDVYTSTHSPILIILSWIEFLPIAHRKAILDTCRIQAPILSNQTLREAYAILPPITATSRDDFGNPVAIQLTVQEMIHLVDAITPFPILCCVLSYLTRAERTVHMEEFEREKTVSLEKEVLAALQPDVRDQVLDYRHVLFGVGRANAHPQLIDGSVRLRALYERGLRQISQYFSSLSTPPLLPRYNARKNVSYETIRNYYDAHGIDFSDGNSWKADVTTLDLLRWYYISGDRIGGALEVRQAWFFNDLKPRTYYCLGGTDFFEGYHIQDIANMFCEILPSTHPHSRFTVSRVGKLSYDELLVTYDYSSFTTSLGELKYFLFWLARASEGISVQVLDVREGIKTVPLSEILDNYNDAVNKHQLFSVERFCEGEETYRLRQGRNGSLGVKGNIVFSTSLHGLALADITGTPDDDCCVGDDALARIRAWVISMFITCVNNLGGINPSKFTMIPRPQEEESIQATQYKFLKRPLLVDHSGLPHLGRLDFFPSIADALFPLGDGIHSATPGTSEIGSAKTFAMQVGRFLTIHIDEPLIIARDEDLDFVLGAFRVVYRKYGLPLEGGIPGGFSIRSGDVGLFFCPPVDSIEVFTTHWLHTLLHRRYGQECVLPVTVGGTIPPPLSVTVGQTFRASSDVAELQLLVDLRVLAKRVETRVEPFTWELLEIIERRLVSRMDVEPVEPLLCSYTVESPPPFWWYDLIVYRHSVLMQEDPIEAVDRVSTIMSGSSI